MDGKKFNIFPQNLLEKLDTKKIPSHVAIVMDGNRRWAKKNKLSYIEGHKRGAENLSSIVEAAAEIGIKVLTVYAFSTENRQRSKGEVAALMKLFQSYLLKYTEKLKKENVRLHVIGDLSKIPRSLKKCFEESLEDTREGKKIDLVIAINYGGRDEITRAFKKIILDYNKKVIDVSNITEELISSYLDTAKMPDPDLLIRTSGELRISNFLLWQSSYAEFCALDVLWPDFSPRHLYDAILGYQQRERRFGKI